MASDPTLRSEDGDTTLTGDEKILARARARFERAIEADGQNRTLALEDDRFKASEQWDPGIRMRREQQRRPCITVNKIPTLVHQVTNDLRQNRPSINVSPLGDKSAKKTAEMIRGYIRAIERNSDAEVAYDTGCDGAVSAGWGYWRLVTDWEEGTFNQCIKVKRVRNRFTVYLDCDRQMPDGSDACWGFVTEEIPKSEFRDQYPDSDMVNFEQEGIGENYKNWTTSTHVRIAEYFEVEKETRTLVELLDGHVGYKDELAKHVMDRIKADPTFIKEEREDICKCVKWYKITAKDILDRTDLPGEWIPIIECVGDEIDLEGRVIKVGLIRNAKGPQQIYNYSSTAIIETVGLQPKAPYIMAEGQDEGHPEWDDANTENYSRLTYKPVSSDGHLAPPPARQPPPQLSPGWLQVQQNAAQDLMGVTGVRFDSTLAERTSDESGIAMQRLAMHQQLGAYHYGDNFALSLKHTGRIMIAWMAKLINTRRNVTILQEDGSDKQVIIDPTAAKAYQTEKDKDGKTVEVYNLTIGQYEVTATIGPNYATKMQESVDGMINLAKVVGPEKAGLFADLIAKQMPFSGSDEISKRISMTLPPGMLEIDETDLNPQVQALIKSQQMQLQHASQQIQMMGQALQEKQSELAIKSADIAVKHDKVNKDYEVEMLGLAEKIGANVISYIQSDLQQIREHEMQRQSAEQQETTGNGADNE